MYKACLGYCRYIDLYGTLTSLSGVLDRVSLLSTIQIVSTTHWSLKTVSLKVAPTVGTWAECTFQGQGRRD